MERLTSWLAERRNQGLLRELVPVERVGNGRLRLAGSPADLLWDFSSNDYLALAEHPAVISESRKQLEELGAGSGAARLMSGDLSLHHRLEEEIARFKGTPAALIFGSGYLANIGIIPALVGRGDLIFGDRLNHASIYDGCLLSGAKFQRFRHNDLEHLEELLRRQRGKGEALIVVESIYSMDGDRAPLKELAALKDKYSCLLMVDEAHATGIFGSRGSGVIEEDGVSAQVDVAMGTFGKALGSYGAYAAVSSEMQAYLVNRARSFVYATALPPAVVGASLAALTVVQNEPERRLNLLAKAAFFKRCLQENGVAGDFGHSQIVPVLVGDSTLALAAANLLRAAGLYVTPVRPPTVPEGTARLRFSITLHHPDDLLRRAAELVGRTLADFEQS
ncbi:MAG: 8-amino-7-oxononanoate synthase [Deltaproteobacteria bacterium RIFOXYD12_FULL_50_9]|nr:MAG: 8-amino-7-oxononanoate synthase [Deltaproteobacteria bacterium RIFOXYD12_FULL_50_9]